MKCRMFGLSPRQSEIHVRYWTNCFRSYRRAKLFKHAFETEVSRHISIMLFWLLELSLRFAEQRLTGLFPPSSLCPCAAPDAKHRDNFTYIFQGGKMGYDTLHFRIQIVKELNIIGKIDWQTDDIDIFSNKIIIRSKPRGKYEPRL